MDNIKLTNLWAWCTLGLQGVVAFLLRLNNDDLTHPFPDTMTLLIQQRDHLNLIIDKQAIQPLPDSPATVPLEAS